MYIIKSKDWEDYITLVVTFYNDGFEDNAYEFMEVQEKELATVFIRKSAAKEIINQFDLKDYKIIEFKEAKKTNNKICKFECDN